MKIAVIFCGHFRVFDKIISQNLKILDKYDCDFFIDTYTEKNNWIYLSNTGKNDVISSDFIKNEFNSLFKGISVDDQQYYYDKINDYGLPLNSIFNFDCGRYLAIELKRMHALEMVKQYAKQNTIAYDLVLFTRCDLLMENFTLDELYNTNALMFSSSWFDSNGQGFLEDSIFAGKIEIFEIFFNNFVNLAFSNETFFEVPHSILYKSLNGIPLITKKLMHSIVRENSILDRTQKLIPKDDISLLGFDSTLFENFL